MSRVKLYVEGGGDSKELRTRCREGFSRLLAEANFSGRMPRLVACGSRETAYSRFKAELAASTSGGYPILLVDSEDPVTDEPWSHLKARDGWACPDEACEDQAQLMVTCMETWIMADRSGLVKCFGACLEESALLPEGGLENRTREEVQNSLEHATRNCDRRKKYRKGKKSFQVLGMMNPNALKQHLSHFRRLVETLDEHLS